MPKKQVQSKSVQRRVAVQKKKVSQYLCRSSKQPLVIENFGVGISWEDIKMNMYVKDFKKFEKWMRGQTCPIGGVYVHDLERFLYDMPVID